MNHWLDPVRLALDSAPTPVTLFYRDDDVGWADDRLFELLDLFATHGLPIDLAAIPEIVTPELARELQRRMHAAPGLLGVHQHGFTHTNHEVSGGKCEFGPSRSIDDQRDDIHRGRQRLNELLGPSVRPIFTPPWNRCTAETGTCLVELGFEVLSRDLSAGLLNIPGLVELPITIDWFERHKGVRLSLHELGAHLAAAIEAGEPVGIMFHHAIMDSDELKGVADLLTLLSNHENAQHNLMWELASHRPVVPSVEFEP